MPYFVKDPGHWRQRAAEMRRIAEGATDPSVRETLFATAAAYDRMADRAAKHTVAGEGDGRGEGDGDA